MKFKNYCIVIMGNTAGVLEEIEKISDTKPNILDAKGIVIATFVSFVEVKDISAWFTLNNRSFLVFELDEKTSSFLITKEEIHKGLFGFLGEFNNNKLDDKTFEFLNVMTNSEMNNFSNALNKKKSKAEDAEIIEEDVLTESDIDKMTKKEKEDLINEIIENGVDKLTENDKKILKLLSK